MIRAAALAATFVIASGSMGPMVARAQESGRTCKLDQVSGLLECTLVAQPAPPRRVRLSIEIPLEWVRVPFTVDEWILQDRGCVRFVGDIREVGAGYAIALNNVVTLEQLLLDFVCAWPGDPAPEPPPPPPSSAELVAANTRVLTVDAALSPPSSIGGLTGLESWLWCDDPGRIGTGVALRGWTASGEVQLVQLGWELGANELAETSTSCGSEAAPSVTWTPESVGEYPVTLTAVWAGTWDLTWNGIAMGTFPLGPIRLTASPQPYPVDEFRGELRG